LRERRQGTDLLEAGKIVKKLFDRLGVTLPSSLVAGPEKGNIIAVQQYSDWKHFAKVQSDCPIAQFVEGIRGDTNPS
jgi:hypothetical protein